MPIMVFLHKNSRLRPSCMWAPRMPIAAYWWRGAVSTNPQRLPELLKPPGRAVNISWMWWSSWSKVPEAEQFPKPTIAAISYHSTFAHLLSWCCILSHQATENQKGALYILNPSRDMFYLFHLFEIGIAYCHCQYAHNDKLLVGVTQSKFRVGLGAALLFTILLPDEVIQVDFILDTHICFAGIFPCKIHKSCRDQCSTNQGVKHPAWSIP